MALNEKRKRFIEEYLIDLDQSQAAIRAGYSEKSSRIIANEIMEDDDVKAYLKMRQEELSKSTTLTKLDILELLETIIQKSCAEPKYYNHAIKGVEVYNKMLGFNEPEKLNVTGDTTINYINPEK